MDQDVSQRRVFTCDPYDWQSLHFPHTCFYVSAVVSRRADAVSRHGYFLHAGGLSTGSYVKTRAASDGPETASV